MHVHVCMYARMHARAHTHRQTHTHTHTPTQVYGVRILDGSLKSSDVVRVTRDAVVLGEAKLTSLRQVTLNLNP